MNRYADGMHDYKGPKGMKIIKGFLARRPPLCFSRAARVWGMYNYAIFLYKYSCKNV